MEIVRKINYYIIKFKHSLWCGVLKLFRVQDGDRVSVWLICIKFLIYPLRTSYQLLNRKFSDKDLLTDTRTIYGVKYTNSFFWALSRYGINTGGVFKIDRTGDNTFTIKELK